MKDRFTMLDFNSVIVIQSLKKSEKQTGKDLYDDIIKRTCEQKGYISLYFEAESKEALENCFNEIYTLCKSQSLFPIIHFEIHGSRSGFQMENYDEVSWENVSDLCRTINLTTNNQLIVSLATCLGAYITLGIDIRKVSPFWGFLGPKDLINQEDVIEDFSRLFEELLSSLNIEKALIAINSNRTKYAYLPAQIIFEKYLEERIFGKKMDKVEKFNSLKSKTKDAFPNSNRIDRRKFLKDKLKKFDRDKLIIALKNHFLMNNIF